MVAFRDACLNLNQWPTGVARTDYLGNADWSVDMMNDPEQGACFANMNAAGISLALGVGALKPVPNCGNATDCFNNSRWRWDRMISNGANIGIFLIDEPLHEVMTGAVPGDYNYALQQTQIYISLLRANYSTARVAETEPYPYFSYLTLRSWVNGLSSGDPSSRPNYFEVDHDWGHGGNIDELNSIKNGSHDAGLGFGYILISNAADSWNDADWYNGVMTQTASYSSLGADLYDISSWLHIPRTTIPESQQYIVSRTH
jgi:hypothetical protein